MPVHNSLIFSTAILGVVSVITFFIQLICGPLVFTKDVVCKKCHTRLKVNRIAFFAGRYSVRQDANAAGKSSRHFSGNRMYPDSIPFDP